MIYVNNRPIQVIKFSGGEIQVNLSNLIDGSKTNIVTAYIKSSDDIMTLIQTKAILDLQGFKQINLVLPYVPYGRSDRVMTDGECSGLKQFAKILNSLNFTNVLTYDPHSDVTEALIDNLTILDQSICIDTVFQQFKVPYGNDFDYIVSPDAGANKKCVKLSKLLSIPMIEASKVRCVQTGKILKTSVNTQGLDLTGKSILIPDDLAEGGRTFSGLAEVLKKEHKVENITLYVTHGLFPNGVEHLKEYIDQIYCYYMWNPVVDPKQFVKWSVDFI